MRKKTPLDKWAFAIGTTSRVPGSKLHYLILDVDHDLDYGDGHPFPFETCFQRTTSGWHIYTPIKMYFKPMLKEALRLGADPAWVRIARDRGYAFLADKSPVQLAWPVERMIIGK